MEYKDEIRLRGYWCQLSNFYMHLYQEGFRTEEELDACYDAVQALSKLEKLMQEKYSIRNAKRRRSRSDGQKQAMIKTIR